MRLADVIRIAFRMFRTNLLRSLLTTLGIGIAISFIVLLIGFGYGLQSVTIGSIISSKVLFSLDIQGDLDEGVELSEQTVEEVRPLAGVEAVSPVVITTGQVLIDEELASVAVNAGNETFMTMEGVEIQTGRAYRDGTREIVVSPQTLELLDINPQVVVGKTVSLSYADPNNENDQKQLDNLLIVGVTSSTDAPALYLPFSLINTGTGVLLTSVKATAIDREAIIAVRNAMTAKGYQVESLVDTLDQARRIFQWATIGLAAFGGIALVVASIGMFNTLTIALIERTREIGIMKAIGVTNQTVRQLFLTEAAIIGLLGGLLGIGIGVGIGSIVEMVVNQMARTYQASTVDLFQHPVWFLVGIAVFPMILSMLTGLYPAIRAARLNPLRALRYE